jgi:hypothetical protein
MPQSKHGKRLRVPGGPPPINFLPLTQTDHDTILTPRWIPPDLAAQAQITRVVSIDGADLIGAGGRPGDYAGLSIPNILPGETRPRAYRLRRDRPDYEWRNGLQKLVRRYLSAPGASNLGYFVPGTPPDQLIDPNLPLVVVEGELKALALHRLAHEGSAHPRFLVLGLSGVFSFRGKVGTASDANGVRQTVKGLIPDFGRLMLPSRLVYVIYDADLNTNPDVRRARTMLTRELLERNVAAVRWVDIPQDAGHKGIDDLLGAWGAERVLELLNQAPNATSSSASAPTYFARDSRLYYKTVDRHGLERDVQLTNFVVQVIENRVVDNGAESHLMYRMRGELSGTSRTFDLPHARFKDPDWPKEMFGTKDAFVEVGQWEYTRRAIGEISLGAPRRTIYGHLGRREVNGESLYLFGSGAIGPAGMLNNIETGLPAELSRYELRLPKSDHEVQQAIVASLRTRDLAPHAITYPLLAITYRAALGPTAFVTYLLGASGVVKTGLAAVFQQHFGPTMGWDGVAYHLPLTFSATANAIEGVLFLAKDSLVVLDNFAPDPDPREMMRRKGILARIMRDIGDQSGRSRLTSKIEMRPTHPPRGTVIVTGEDIVRHNIGLLGRTLVLEVAKGAVDMANLTQSQEDGERGLLCTAMAAFIQWLLSSFDVRMKKFRERVDVLRKNFTAHHRRTPSAFAELQAAMEMFLEFALDVGAVYQRNVEDLMNEFAAAFVIVAGAQAKEQLDADPALRFRELVQSLITTHRAHLLTTDGREPQDPERFGYRLDGNRSIPGGDCIGWIGDGNIYLDSGVAFAAAQKLASEQGERLGITEEALRKRLDEAKLLAGVDATRRRLTVRRTIMGRPEKEVLWIVGDFLGGA